ncbi:hypothetical protein, partial [Shigella flexneri]|uniref:hypothetical protein n=1 Tax=Shigella flexneri TaxID=623 RepID=UPI003CF0C69C
SDGNGSHASTLKSPSYTKSVSWQHYRVAKLKFDDAVRGVFPYVLVLYSLLVVFVFIPDLIILPLKWIN